MVLSFLEYVVLREAGEEATLHPWSAIPDRPACHALRLTRQVLPELQQWMQWIAQAVPGGRWTYRSNCSAIYQVRVLGRSLSMETSFTKVRPTVEFSYGWAEDDEENPFGDSPGGVKKRVDPRSMAFLRLLQQLAVAHQQQGFVIQAYAGQTDSDHPRWRANAPVDQRERLYARGLRQAGLKPLVLQGQQMYGQWEHVRTAPTWPKYGPDGPLTGTP